MRFAFLLTWVAASAALGLRLVRALVGGRRILRRADRVEEGPAFEDLREARNELGLSAVELRRSHEVGSPMVWSWSGLPVVVIPANTGRKVHWTAVFRHELAHHRRRDHWFSLANRLLLTLIPFHPLLWWSMRRHRTLCEQACDDWAVRDPAESIAYAESLMSFLPRPRGSVGMAAARNRDDLRRRMGRILDADRVSPALGAASRLGALAITAAAVATLSLAQAGEDRGSEAAAPEQIRGLVVDPEGQPLRGVEVALLRRPADTPSPIGVVEEKVVSDDGGAFSLSWRPSMATNARSLNVLAWAPGRALGWAPVDFEDPTQELRIELPEPLELSGHLIDLSGTPVAGATVQLHAMSDGTDTGLGHSGELPAGLAIQQAHVTSTATGRFEVAGVRPGCSLTLDFHHPDHASRRRRLSVSKTNLEELTLVLDPPQRLEGTVMDLRSGEPIEGAEVRVECEDGDDFHASVSGKSDARGRYSIPLYTCSELRVVAVPPADSGYLPKGSNPQWPGEKVALLQNYSLLRGSVVRGVVRDDAGEPVAGVRISHRSRERANEHYREDVVQALREWQVFSDGEGRFSLSVLPGPGHLVVRDSTQRFARIETSYNELEGRKPGGSRYAYHGLAAVEIEPDGESGSVEIELLRAKTLRGSVLSVAGSPVPKAEMYGSAYRTHTDHYSQATLDIVDGEFEMPGLRPGERYEFYVLDAKNQEGAMIVLDETTDLDAPLTVRLEPCGRARVQYLDGDLEPIAHTNFLRGPLSAHLTQVIKEGGVDFIVNSEQIAAENHHVVNLDRERYHALKTDADGFIEYPSLIGGATYFVMCAPGNSWMKVAQFTAKAGERIELEPIELATGL